MAIQQCDSSKLPIIQSLAIQTWPYTYKNIISELQIHYMLEWMYNLDTLNQQLNDGHVFFLAINDKHEPVGFSSFSKTTETNSFHLHKLYVLPEQQKKGWGKLLLEHIFSEIEKCNGGSLTLNVNRNNPAIEFYKKYDFVIKKEVNNDIGKGFSMNDYVMKKTFEGITLTKPIDGVL